MMTITQVVTTLPAAPDPATMTRDQFNTAAAAYVIAQKAMVPELNTWAGQANTMATGMSAIATGAALAIPLTFSTTTTDSDPGNGIVRLDNATQNAATTIRTDLIGNDGSTWTDVIALFDDSTSTVKGFITLVDTTDATKWLVFSVASLATPSGYVNITVACVASSAANPFANGASLALQFTRTGDKGDTGAAGAGITPQAVGWTGTGGTTPKTLTVDADVTASLLAQTAASQVEAEAGTGTEIRNWTPERVAQAIAALGGGGLKYLSTVTLTGQASADIENGFGATYDDYLIVGDVVLSGADILLGRWKFAGAYDTGTNYLSHLDGATTTTTKTAYLDMSTVASGTGHSVDYWLHNVNSSAIKRGFIEQVITTATPGINHVSYSHTNTATTALQGVRVYTNGGATMTGTFKLYGIAKA